MKVRRACSILQTMISTSTKALEVASECLYIHNSLFGQGGLMCPPRVSFRLRSRGQQFGSLLPVEACTYRFVFGS